MGVAHVATDCETLRVSVNEPVDDAVTIELYRPDARNALSTQLRAELLDMLDALEDEMPNVLVLTGADGTGAFAAGADIKELRERDGLEQREMSKRPRIFERIDEFPRPVIARINGHALGGGCELVQACDVRIAHEDAKLGQPEINLGLMPGGGGTQRLPRLVGEGHAMRLILSGELIDATEAADIGLVEEAHSDETFDERVADLAGAMAEKSPITLELTKKAVGGAKRMNLREGVEYEAELFAQLFGTGEKDEGIDAFLEDRDPEWRGR